ncbi:MAG: hypothetical protein QM669_10970 [Siphonobacter sp.]
MTYQTPDGQQLSGNSPVQILESLRDSSDESEEQDLETYLDKLIEEVKEDFNVEIVDRDLAKVLPDLYLTLIED